MMLLFVVQLNGTDNDSCVFNEEGEPRAKIEQAQTELKDANDKLQTDYDTVVAVIRRNI